MNIVDLCIIAVIGASVLFGIYRGFVSSVLNTGGCIIAFVLSIWIYPLIAGPIQGNTQLQNTLLNYSNALTRMGDQALGSTVVSQASADLPNLVQRVLDRVSLPGTFGGMLEQNMLSGAGSRVLGAGATVQDYVSMTIVTACVNIFSFLLCFAIVYLALSLILSAVRSVFKLPVLKQMDSLAGAGLGLLRGILLLFVIFTLLPVAETFLPTEAVSEQVRQSTLAGFFSSDVLVSAIFRARIF